MKDKAIPMIAVMRTVKVMIMSAMKTGHWRRKYVDTSNYEFGNRF